MTYTSHGHHILGTSRDDEVGQVDKARCGGPAVCTICQQDVASVYAQDAQEAGIVSPGNPFEDTSEYGSDNDRYLKAAKLFVVGAANNSRGEDDMPLSVDNLYIVWFAKVLGNWKALISTDIPGDGLYFEVTHNGEKNETYVDTYVKASNDKFSQEGQ